MPTMSMRVVRVVTHRWGTYWLAVVAAVAEILLIIRLVTEMLVLVEVVVLLGLTPRTLV